MILLWAPRLPYPPGDNFVPEDQVPLERVRAHARHFSSQRTQS
jgi:hypothetical protein